MNAMQVAEEGMIPGQDQVTGKEIPTLVIKMPERSQITIGIWTGPDTVRDQQAGKEVPTLVIPNLVITMPEMSQETITDALK